MIDTDPVLRAVAKLPLRVPSPVLSRSLQARAHARLLPAKVHPAFPIAVAASVVAYLGWAVFYTSQLY